jgi:metal-responsive CopG/Arc/MetJ family transcriptional regulator
MKPGDESGRSVRVSVTIPKTDHEDLERIARDKRVSLAWVIRDAVDSYLAQRSPLFRGRR